MKTAKVRHAINTFHNFMADLVLLYDVSCGTLLNHCKYEFMHQAFLILCLVTTSHISQKTKSQSLSHLCSQVPGFMGGGQLSECAHQQDSIKGNSQKQAAAINLLSLRQHGHVQCMFPPVSVHMSTMPTSTNMTNPLYRHYAWSEILLIYNECTCFYVSVAFTLRINAL